MSMKPARVFLLLALVGILIGAGNAWYKASQVPKRFAPVIEGQLYRSGLVAPQQLQNLKEEYGITRVICLLNPDAPETLAERSAAEKLGIEWHNIPMGGSGESTAPQRVRLLELMTTRDAPPTLVHCSAGVNRTGLAVGLYRIHKEGWTYEQVLAELRANDFDDLPKHEDLRAALRAAADQATADAATPAETPQSQ